MSDIQLDKLDIEDLQKVQNLINKLIGKKQDKTTNKPKENKKSNINKIGTEKNPRKISSHKNQKTNRRKRQLTPAQQEVADNEEGVGGTGTICRRETLNTGPRPNLFLESKDYNAHKKDIAIDKLLLGKNKPSEKRDAVEYIEIDCYKCGFTFVTTSNKIYKVGNEYKAECNRCSSVKNT